MTYWTWKWTNIGQKLDIYRKGRSTWLIGQMFDKFWTWTNVGQTLDMDEFKTNIGHCLQISGKIYVWTIIGQTLDIHLPNFCPIFGQIRKWSKRLDIRRTNTWQKMDNCPNIWQILDITWTWANIGQTLDKTSTIIGYLSKICPIFVRSPVVQEHPG